MLLYCWQNRWRCFGELVCAWILLFPYASFGYMKKIIFDPAMPNKMARKCHRYAKIAGRVIAPWNEWSGTKTFLWVRIPWKHRPNWELTDIQESYHNQLKCAQLNSDDRTVAVFLSGINPGQLFDANYVICPFICIVCAPSHLALGMQGLFRF